MQVEEHYEKIILGAAALAAIGFGAWHISTALSFKDQFGEVEATPQLIMPDIAIDEVTQSEGLLEAKFVWQDKTVSVGQGKNKPVPLFVSVPIIELNDELFDLSNPTSKPIRPPMTNKWLIDNQLDFLRADIGETDPDDDGYSNLEEFRGETDPVDEESHPPYTDKLLFVDRKERLVMLRFGANTGGRFQIKWQAQGGRQSSGFMEIGDTFGPDNRFTIERIVEKEGPNQLGVVTDISELIISDTETGRDVVLVLRQDQIWPTYFAEFNFTLDSGQSEFYVQEGKTFQLDLEPGKDYKVLKIEEGEVTIESGEGTVTLQKGQLKTPGPDGMVSTPGAQPQPDEPDPAAAGEEPAEEEGATDEPPAGGEDPAAATATEPAAEEAAESPADS